MKKVYLDNGATTQVAKEVAQTMQKTLTKKFGNPNSLHSFGEEAKIELEKARGIIAKKINAEPSEIIFTSGATESDNLAIKGVAYKHRDKGNHIITSKIEHPAVLSTCEALEKEGFRITYLSVDKEGFIDLKKLEKAITPETILITIIHANNEIGTVQDIEEIGKTTYHTKEDTYVFINAVKSYLTGLGLFMLNCDIRYINDEEIDVKIDVQKSKSFLSRTLELFGL